ncbi:putative ATPase [Paraburkholderia bannensis]|uniref:Putative ATPase n=1 Tax=Paraburkholderia bannensis TaxID=765414 RepID=A0A7W9TYQ7_9BURK|nr:MULTISPECIES: winged helix-turn-helix domain-containing protein [Paraburkholderia]MBB3257787.1 putative ATPase/DNA-binding winged helix-turn-helix (wHTH) protein [Paraburkholderia sp. WP4_3_2]MBB6102800.1 putative ATPase [Paraburkholderia bannensis]
MLEVGDVLVDFERHHVERAGTAISIGCRALDILQILVEAEGKVVSKHDILQKVWPYATVEENNLHVHIAALRRIIGRGRELIKTIPGRGYLLVRETSRPKTIESRPSSTSASIPRVQSRLFGRDDAQRTILGLLSRCRIITLVGAGGIGKSSLAVAVANVVHSQGMGRVTYIDFAEASTETAVCDSFLGALNLPRQPNPLTATHILDTIAYSTDVYVLDNVEQVIDTIASLIEELVSRSSTLTILVTTRQPLGLLGETLFRLMPLATPDDTCDVDLIEACPAVALFIDRVRARAHPFAVTSDSLIKIAEICRRLDGVPLAIELAAARVATTGVEFLANRLNDRLNLLTSGMRQALPRHRSLRASFDWSYMLLAPVEQRLFRRLGFFSDSFSLCEVCAIAGGLKLTQAQCALLLEKMAEKSLVSLQCVSGQMRYQLSECLRAYAVENLRKEGEFDEVLEAYRHGSVANGAGESVSVSG